MQEGPRSNLKRLREGKEKLVGQLRALQETEKTTEPDNDDVSKWTTYDSKAFGVGGYFREVSGNSFGKLIGYEEVRNSIAKKKEQGGKVLVLDIMGQGGVGKDLDADLSVGWTYEKKEWLDSEGRDIQPGNLFDPEVLRTHIQELKKQVENGYELTDVFFRPQGGLGMYRSNPYVLAYLYDNVLRTVYDLAPVGARFYIGTGKIGTAGVASVMESLMKTGFEIKSDRHQFYLLIKTEKTLILPALKTL